MICSAKACVTCYLILHDIRVDLRLTDPANGGSNGTPFRNVLADRLTLCRARRMHSIDVKGVPSRGLRCALSNEDPPDI